MANYFANKSERDNAVCIGAEGDRGNVFASLPIDGRALAHAASVACAALMLRTLGKRMREAERAKKEARRRLDRTRGLHKDPRRSTGMNLIG